MTEFLSYATENSGELLSQTLRHLFLVSVAVGIAIAVGVPTGLACAKKPRAAAMALGFANVTQTVPSLAMFGFLIPLPLIGGIGATTAIIALMLYALLPIVKNTVTGVRSIEPSVIEAATAMGMTRRQLLRRVEIPLSIPVILAGIRIATVVSVGTATIAAAAGAEGLGVFIFRGLNTNNENAMLLGALPAALLALLLDLVLSRIENVLRRQT